MPGYLPLNYEQINVQAGTYFPSQIHTWNTASFKLWERALFQRACSTLILKLPEIWKENKALMYWCLFAYGFVGCGELPDIGKWFNPGTFKGFDFYYRPTTFILTNPYYGQSGISKELEIGKDCQIIKLSPDYRGIFHVLCRKDRMHRHGDQYGYNQLQVCLRCRRKEQSGSRSPQDALRQSEQRRTGGIL